MRLNIAYFVENSCLMNSARVAGLKKKKKEKKKAKNAEERNRKRKREPNKRRLKYNSIFYM